MDKISHDELNRRLHYDPDTGLFTRLVRYGKTQNRYVVGAVVGSMHPYGYRVVRLYPFGDYKAHRLAFFYMTGKWPKELDHINRVRDDNRFCNLREVEHRENQQNRVEAYSNNRSGLMGVSTNRTLGPATYTASISAGGKRIRLGVFRTAQEAHAAYLGAKRTYHPAFQATDSPL